MLGALLGVEDTQRRWPIHARLEVQLEVRERRSIKACLEVSATACCAGLVLVVVVVARCNVRSAKQPATGSRHAAYALSNWMS